MRYRPAVRAEGDVVGDQSPPVALFAQSPAAEPAGDDAVQLQAVRVVSANPVWGPRKQRREVDQNRYRRPNRPQWRPNRLAVVSDRREFARHPFHHMSIICSNTGGDAPSVNVVDC